MVATCKSLGITPLTQQEWDEENRRIYVEYNRRRNGISGARNPGDPYVYYEPKKYNFGTYTFGS